MILDRVRTTADLPSSDMPFESWWTVSSDHAPVSTRKGLSSLLILTAWWLWKHRDGCIFDGDRPLVTHISGVIKDEACLWAKAGATGLRNILPDT